MRRGMRKPHSLILRRYADRLVDLKNYLASFPGGTLSDNIEENSLDIIMLNIMPNSWSKQAYIQGFYCELISLKKYVNTFDRMEIAESIYEGVLEPSYKKYTRADINRAGHIKKYRGEVTCQILTP